MNVQEHSKQAVLMIEAAGLAVTTLALFVIAYGLELGVRLTTNGALDPGVGVFAYGFLFYVCASFLAAATRHQPDRPISPCANVLLNASFLSVGWSFWMSHAPVSRLALAIACLALIHGGTYGFALLRRQRIRVLLRERAAIRDAFVDRYFVVRSATFLAIPIGAALGMALGSIEATKPWQIVRHAMAGTFFAITLDQLVRIVAGASALARSLTATQVEARASARGRDGDAQVTVSAVGPTDKYPLRVHAPEPSASNAELGVAAASIAANIRRLILLNQLERMALLAISFLAVWRLEFPFVSAWPPTLGLLAASLLVTQVPYWIGQGRANERVLSPLVGPLRKETPGQLSKRASVALTAGSWAAWLAAGALAGLTYQCVQAAALAELLAR